MKVSTRGLRVYLRDLGPMPSLSEEDALALAKRIGLGDGAARARLIQAGLRIAVDIARQYERTGLPLLDLISEGQSALTGAVDRFHPGCGEGFRAFAGSLIRRSIERLVDGQEPAVRPAAAPAPVVTTPSRMDLAGAARAAARHRPVAFHRLNAGGRSSVPRE